MMYKTNITKVHRWIFNDIMILHQFIDIKLATIIDMFCVIWGGNVAEFYNQQNLLYIIVHSLVCT